MRMYWNLLLTLGLTACAQPGPLRKCQQDVECREVLAQARSEGYRTTQTRRFEVNGEVYYIRSSSGGRKGQ